MGAAGARLAGVRTIRRNGRTSPLAVATIAGTLLYSWVAAGLRPFTGPENVAVALPVLLALVFLARRWGQPVDAPDPDPEHARACRVAGTVWIGLVSLLVAWELVAYFSSPRYDHPTLSTVADDIMSNHPGRAAMFVLWLALAWLLFIRPRPGRP
jgi:hypothetical protein